MSIISICDKSGLPLIKETGYGTFCNGEKCECEQISKDLIRFSSQLSSMINNIKGQTND